MTRVERSTQIDGLVIVNLVAHSDERGRLIETYRQEWFGDVPSMVQGNRSDSGAGVVRALHFHHHQADYWYAPVGRIFVGLHDLRRSSPTAGATVGLEIGGNNQTGLYIPPGVAHGFQAVTDATLTYLVDRYYDAADEHGVAWDDPDIGVPWPLEEAILSERDQANPALRDLPPVLLPA